MNYDLYWIWMSCGLGAGASCLDLVTYYEWNPYEIYASSFNEIFSLDMLTKRQVEKLKSFSLDEAQKIYDTVKANGWEMPEYTTSKPWCWSMLEEPPERKSLPFHRKYRSRCTISSVSVFHRK